jgi:hypothetical protein
MAQVPVPVPMSRMACGLGASGAKKLAAGEAFVDGLELHIESVALEFVVGEHVGVAVAAEGVVGAAVALFEEVFGRGDGAGAAGN